MPAGSIDELLARFSEIRRKAFARTGKSLEIIVIQEAGLDGFWIYRVLQNEGIESHVVDPASIATSRRRRRAKTDRIDGETRPVFLPPHTPELQPVETLWALVDEPIVNKYLAIIDELDKIIGQRCVALANQRDAIKSRAGFHLWPILTSAN